MAPCLLTSTPEFYFHSSAFAFRALTLIHESYIKGPVPVSFHLHRKVNLSLLMKCLCWMSAHPHTPQDFSPSTKLSAFADTPLIPASHESSFLRLFQSIYRFYLTLSGSVLCYTSKSTHPSLCLGFPPLKLSSMLNKNQTQVTPMPSFKSIHSLLKRIIKWES